MSSKSVAFPAKIRSHLDQDLDGILSDRFIYNGQSQSGVTPIIDLKRLVDNYFRENAKKLKKNVGALWDVKQTNMLTSADYDEKSYPAPLGNVNDRYKTELCRPFSEKGECKYAAKCQYAHGAHELRAAPRHMKHKTKRCHKFHSTGFCNYGSRCTYIHNEEEDMNSKVNSISPPSPHLSVANNAFSFPPLVRLPSISSSSSDSTSNGFESRNSSPISFDGNHFTFSPSPYFAGNERAMHLPQYMV